ncbi:MAG: DUF5684 domain-containing protein [Microthrixaceae bacterium]
MRTPQHPEWEVLMLGVLHTVLQNDFTVTSESSSGGGAGFVILMLVYLAFFILFLVGYWKVFTKMGLPGWMGIVPFVNIYMVYKARGKREPIVWLILALIPCIQIIALWFLASDTAEIYDKELGWKIFLFIIPGISHLVLGFGSAQANPANMAPGVGLNKGGYGAPPAAPGVA